MAISRVAERAAWRVAIMLGPSLDPNMDKAQLLAYLEDYYPGDMDKGRFTELIHAETGQVVPLPEGVIGYLDSHPEGPDRGGYVPWLELPSGASVFHHYDEWS